MVIYKPHHIPYCDDGATCTVSGKVWRALNLANWLLEGIGKIGDLDS